MKLTLARLVMKATAPEVPLKIYGILLKMRK